jgi:hypothetical protein
MTHRTQDGQAVVEVLAASLLLIPLLLALQAIAEYQAVSAQATQTARLLALGSSLVGRSLRIDALIAQAPELLAVNEARRVMRGSLTRGAEPREAAAATRALSAALVPVEFVSGSRLALERSGWVRAQAQVSVDPPLLLQETLGAAPINVASSMTLLTEDYQANGRDEVGQRIGSLDAMQPLRQTLRGLRPLTALLQVFDPPFRSLCARRADPDVLPGDRLSFVAARPAAACP